MDIIKFFALVSLILIAISIPVFALAHYKKNSVEIPVILDMQNAPQLPKRFRTTSNLPNDKEMNWHGFKDLNMLGSGQFSKAAFGEIIKNLHHEEFIVVDLRQESHGFLNGNAICWYGFRASENAGKSADAIEQDQASRLTELAKNENVFVHKIIQKDEDGVIQKTKPIEFAVHELSSEEEFVKSVNAQYYRFYIQDYHAPDDDQVDRFVAMVKELPKHKWIYFHCRAGIGRTTTFMAMYDMMRNAKNVSFEDILAREVKIGGKNLAELPAKGSFKYKNAKQRLVFLQSFYEYASQNNDAFKTSWTAWLMRN